MTGVHNNDPTWMTITDFNFDEYRKGDVPWLARVWARHTHYLEHMLPSDEELVRRWWRCTFTAFVQRTLRNYGLPKCHFKKLGSEEYLLGQVYPWMRPLWLQKRVQMTAFVPSIPALRKRWWYGKRHDFYCRYKNGRGDCPRYKLRLDIALTRALWCRHRVCWKVRLTVLIILIVIFHLIYALIYL